MDKAEDLIRQVLKAGASPDTLYLVLSRMKEEGRTGEVIQECLRALDFYPYNFPLRTLLAEAYMEGGFIMQAEKEIEHVVTQSAHLFEAYKLQARIYLRQQRKDEALEVLRKCLVLNPDDHEVQDLLGNLEPLGGAPHREEAGPGEKEPIPEKAPEETVPELATPTLGEIYFNQGQLLDAIETYQKVLLRNPDDKDSRRRLAELQAFVAENSEHVMAERDTAKIKREKMIGILEAWLNRIQELNRAS